MCAPSHLFPERVGVAIGNRVIDVTRPLTLDDLLKEKHYHNNIIKRDGETGRKWP